MDKPISTQPRRYPKLRMTVVAFWLLTLAAYGQGSLRPDIEHDLTLFRVLVIPLGGYLAWRFRALSIIGIALTTLLLYSCVQQLAHPYPVDWISIRSFFVAALVLVFMIIIYQTAERLGSSFLAKHLIVVYLISFVGAALEYWFGVEYPNVISRKQYIDLWSGNGNIASVGIAAVATTFLYAAFKVNRPRATMLALLASIPAILLLLANSSRAALVGLLAIVWLHTIMAAVRFAGMHSTSRVFVSILITTVAAMGVLSIPPIVGGIEMILNGDINSQLIEPTIQVLRLDADKNLTAVGVRTHLTVVGIHKFFDSYGLGIGPGGSYRITAMLYSHVSSFHNPLIQLLTEFGFLFLIPCLGIFAIALKKLSLARIMLFAAHCLALAFISISDTSLQSNYLFLSAAVFTVFLGIGKVKFSCKI